ncbi:MAG: nucleotidyltransferase [Opitutaceae bacterium]|nr:nucleotidyltransferase [Cytophagales bacterium]
MDIADEELLKIVSAFNKNGVIYMLVGGFAVNYYGYNRTTADFDLWAKPSNENQINIANSMIEMGFTRVELSDFLAQDFSQPVNFQIGGNTFYIDVMNHITGVNFEEAYLIAVDDLISSKLPLKIIHRNHLIINKVLTGRTKDKADVEILQRIGQKNP